MNSVFRFHAIVVILAVWSLSSCGIYDDDNADTETTYVEYHVSPKIVDVSGSSSFISQLQSLKAYLFIDGIFSQIVTAGQDGKYSFQVSSSFSGSAQVVAIGTSSTDSLQMDTPVAGDSISRLYFGVRQTRDGVPPYLLYYGKYQGRTVTTRAADLITLQVDTTLTMSARNVTLHLIIQHITDFISDASSCRVVVSGFRNKISFEGLVCGDSVSYTPVMTFDSASNHVSTPILTLPTMTGDRVKVSVYDHDELVWYTDTDDDGNAVTLQGGDNKALVINCRRSTITMHPVPWGEYAQYITM